MAIPEGLDSIPGAQQLHDWFGYWPGFHDAEVIRLHFNRTGMSSLLIHTWEMTKQTDSRGYYELVKHVVVEFVFDGISNLNLEGFSHQNVIFGLDITKIESGFCLVLDPCYGVSGSIEAESVSIQLIPGKPS